MSKMPDEDDDAYTIIDWIDEVNTLTAEDPADDDDESSGTSDPMDGYDLDGEEEDDESDEM